MTLARSWESNEGTAFPPEVAEVLKTGSAFRLEGIRFLLAIPEYKVPIPGGDRASQTDIMALAKTLNGLMVMAVEGKVDEHFGPMLSEKKAEQSEGFNLRLDWLLKQLKLPATIPGEIRYQLIHRTASALLIANEYCARHAVMLVHSFSQTDKGFSDFYAFASLFDVKAEMGRLLPLGEYNGVDLFIAWCRGDQRFRSYQDSRLPESAGGVETER